MADPEGVFQYYCRYHLPVMTGQLRSSTIRVMYVFGLNVGSVIVTLVSVSSQVERSILCFMTLFFLSTSTWTLSIFILCWKISGYSQGLSSPPSPLFINMLGIVPSSFSASPCAPLVTLYWFDLLLWERL